MARFEEIEERLARVPERRWMMMADEGQTWRIGYRGRGNSFWMPDSMTDEAALVAHAAEDIEWLLSELRRTRVDRGDALHFRDEYHSQLADEQKRAEAAEAEVARLREALAVISKQAITGYTAGGCEPCRHSMMEADHALAPQPAAETD